jgi:hypothetical protein
MSNPIRIIARSAVVCAAITAIASQAVPALASSPAPSYVTFDKHFAESGPNGDPYIFEGTTGGAAPGTVRTVCHLAPRSEILVQLSCDWQITAGGHSFDAPLTGTLNGQTGQVTMNGQIASGWQAGAQVHETGHLVNATALEFAGTIQIQP